MMEYKGYLGCVEYDDAGGEFSGEVVGTRDVISFHGTTVEELKQEFQKSVDTYLMFCRERGREPEKPFSGRFVARITPELHRQISLAAALRNQSLNSWVAEQLQNAASAALEPVRLKRTAPAGRTKKAPTHKKGSDEAKSIRRKA